ncbi:MAG: helix-turn-helix transcriptional regulator [Archaeoglobaceae archaeon]
MDTREEILDILEKKGSILQKDLWKELSIDSSKCSRILRKLEKEDLIRRVEIVVDGVKTFKIVSADAEIEEEKEDEFSLQYVMEKMEDLTGLPPCFGCTEYDCEAVKCIKLEVWFLRVSQMR